MTLQYVGSAKGVTNVILDFCMYMNEQTRDYDKICLYLVISEMIGCTLCIAAVSELLY